MIAFDSSAFSVTAFSPEAFAFGQVADSSLPGEYGGRSTHDDYALHREHWEYIEGLREIHVQVADDIHGVRDIAIPLDMRLPESFTDAMNIKPRAMRGKVLLPTVADVIHDPLILAALIMLVDEARAQAPLQGCWPLATGQGRATNSPGGTRPPSPVNWLSCPD